MIETIVVACACVIGIGIGLVASYIYFMYEVARIEL